MRKKITITPQTGEPYEVELVMEFEIVETGNRYVVYTLNEVINEDLVQLYVAGIQNLNGEEVATDNLSDDEWTKIKEIMREVLAGGNK